MIKENSIAKIVYDDETNKIISFDIKKDINEIEIDKDVYFNGDENFTEKEYELIYNFICNKCKEQKDVIFKEVNGKIKVVDNSPKKPTKNQLKDKVRYTRNIYLQETDKFMIADYPIDNELKNQYKNYRDYLRDYTKKDNWWDCQPCDFETYKLSLKEEEPVPYIPTEKDNLKTELLKAKTELQELDYIGIKIATGRATIEEYAEEIAYMNELVEKVNELNAKLKEIE